MAEEPSSSQRILDAAEAVLRRHGVGKTNVVDIARVLGMSHANVYRHFPSKKALLDAVAARWLEAVEAPLQVITQDRHRPAAERLAVWFETLRAIKRRKILHDPELFRVYHGIATDAHEAVAAHVNDLLGQIEHILQDGVAAGEFPAGLETRTAARAFLHGTVQFHHPAMVVQEPTPSDAEAKAVLDLLLAGLRAHPLTDASRAPAR